METDIVTEVAFIDSCKRLDLCMIPNTKTESCFAFAIRGSHQALNVWQKTTESQAYAQVFKAIVLHFWLIN